MRAGVRLLEDTSTSPRLDAELLLAHALGWERTRLFMERTWPVAAEPAQQFLDLVAARRRHQPVAQLVGRREFWSLPLQVTADVLVPRPETERLVELALMRLPAGRAARVADLGTGSGAIVLALASERPECAFWASDSSPAALEVARRNAADFGLERVHFVLGDWCHALPAARFDLIVSNPPYIADDEWAHSDAELEFEPRQALAGGSDGLDALRLLAASAPAHLAPGGWLLLEHGRDQSMAVRALLEQAGFTDIATHADLAGQPRVTLGRRP